MSVNIGVAVGPGKFGLTKAITKMREALKANGTLVEYVARQEFVKPSAKRRRDALRAKMRANSKRPPKYRVVALDGTTYTPHKIIPGGGEQLENKRVGGVGGPHHWRGGGVAIKKRVQPKWSPRSPGHRIGAGKTGHRGGGAGGHRAGGGVRHTG